MVGALFVLALLAAAAFVSAAGTQSASGSGPCVRARPPRASGSRLYVRVRHSCSGSQKMYAFVQARSGPASHVYTLASGSTTGKSLKIGAPRCVYAGTWHVWAFAARGQVADASRVVNYTCSSNLRARKAPR